MSKRKIHLLKICSTINKKYSKRYGCKKKIVYVMHENDLAWHCDWAFCGECASSKGKRTIDCCTVPLCRDWSDPNDHVFLFSLRMCKQIARCHGHRCMADTPSVWAIKLAIVANESLVTIIKVEKLFPLTLFFVSVCVLWARLTWPPWITNRSKPIGFNRRFGVHVHCLTLISFFFLARTQSPNTLT